MIASSIMDIEAASSVRWVPRTDPNNLFYVRIKKDEAGCFANVGRTANGIMNLGTNCVVCTSMSMLIEDLSQNMVVQGIHAHTFFLGVSTSGGWVIPLTSKQQHQNMETQIVPEYPHKLAFQRKGLHRSHSTFFIYVSSAG